MRAETAVGDQEAINNQVQVLLSRNVALDVIRKLKLADNPEFDSVGGDTGALSSFKYMMMAFGLAQDPFRVSPEERALEKFSERLTAYAADKSRVIVAEFQSRDPELAAKVVNAVA